MLSSLARRLRSVWFLRAQSVSNKLRPAASSSRSIADAPLRNADLQNSPEHTSPADGSANVAGTVLDASGAGVPGAEVSLAHGDGTQLRTMASEENGEFNFTKIPPGPYVVIVNAKGFALFTSAEFVVTVQQAYEVPNVSLSIASASMEMTVRPTEFIAAEQIRAQEKQRLIGFFPNFYTSYVYDAAPLTSKQKFSLATRGTFDPVAMIGVGIAAGIEQATNAYAGYGQGAAGYAKRFAAKFVDGRSSDFLTHAIFPSLLHQDPRYYYQGSGSVKSRLMHAVSSAFVTRSDSGRGGPTIPISLATCVQEHCPISTIPKPTGERIWSSPILPLASAGRLGTNLLREFLSKRLTTNASGNGKS